MQRILFLFFVMLATAHANADVIAFQFPDRWLGINAGHQLLDVRLNEGGVLIGATESRPSEAQRLEIDRLAGQVFDEKLLADNRRKTEVPPPDMPGAPVSRCSVFAKDTGRLWEFHFYVLTQLPACLQEALQSLETMAKGAKPATDLDGFILCNDLSRSFAPDGLTYAQLYRKNGVPFLPAQPASFPASFSVLKRCAQYPGTLEKVTKAQVAEILKVPVKMEGAFLIDVESRDVGCVYFSFQASTDPEPLPPGQRRVIIEDGEPR